MSGFSPPELTGTFTPALRFGGGSTGITYSTTPTGRWRRSGGEVSLQGRLILTSKGSSTGAATIAGLPFAALALPIGYCVPFLGSMSGVVSPILYVTPSATTAELFENLTGAALTDARFTDTSTINFDLRYRV